MEKFLILSSHDSEAVTNDTIDGGVLNVSTINMTNLKLQFIQFQLDDPTEKFLKLSFSTLENDEHVQHVVFQVLNQDFTSENVDAISNYIWEYVEEFETSNDDVKGISFGDSMSSYISEYK